MATPVHGRIVGHRNYRTARPMRLPARVWCFAVGGAVTHGEFDVAGELFQVGVDIGPVPIPGEGETTLDAFNWNTVGGTVTTPAEGTYVVEW